MDTQCGSLNHVLWCRGCCKTTQGYLNNVLIFLLNFNIYLYTLLLVLSNKSLLLIVFLMKPYLTLIKLSVIFIIWLPRPESILYSSSSGSHRIKLSSTLEPLWMTLWSMVEIFATINVKENRCEPEHIAYIKLIFRPMYFDLIDVCWYTPASN